MNQTSKFQMLDASIKDFVDTQINTRYEFYDISIFRQLLKELKYNVEGYCPEFLYSIVSQGIFPMSMYNQLYPKLHHYRCMIMLKDWNFDLENKQLVIYNAILKRKLKNVAKRIYKEKQENKYQYFLQINKNHKEIFDFCRKNIFSFWINDKYANTITELSNQVYQFKSQKFQFYIIGLYQQDMSNKQNKLVATEIGYRYGTVYVSMSGCYDKKYCNFGNLSLFSLGMLLKEKQYELWDLGMIMSYKTQIGGKKIQRSNLIEIYQSINKNSEDFEQIVFGKQQINWSQKDEKILKNLKQISYLKDYHKIQNQQKKIQRQ